MKCISVVGTLDESSSLGLNLKVYIKHADHTLNLVASLDAKQVTKVQGKELTEDLAGGWLKECYD